VREQTVARLDPAFGNAEAEAIASDRASRLWTAIDTLQPRLRLVVVLAACSTSARMFSPADADAIRAVLHAQQDAWNRGDLDAFMAAALAQKAFGTEPAHVEDVE